MTFFHSDSDTYSLSKKQPVPNGFYYGVRRIEYNSLCLDRLVIIDVVYPLQTGLDPHSFNLLLLNDGQDLVALDYVKTMDKMQPAVPLLTFAIHAGNRMSEFGVAGVLDYMGRGSQAAHYHKFLATELCTSIFEAFGLNKSPVNVAIAGCSLGALSAFDFAWSHSDKVCTAGCFSGSFWWRSQEFGPSYNDKDRIMHQKILDSEVIPDIRVWFQAGTADEKHDRSGRGMIDVIHDVKDLMHVMKLKNFSEHHVHYLEIEGGRHDQVTWGKAIPEFLRWAFNDPQ